MIAFKPEQELEPAPAPSQQEQPEQPEQPEPKHVAKHLPQTGSTTTTIFASAIASLFAGLVELVAALKYLRRN